eukprot:2128031-Rhodomonas_salina.5
MICMTTYKAWKDLQRMLRDICELSGRNPIDEQEGDEDGEEGATDIPSRPPVTESAADWQDRPRAHKLEQVITMLDLLQRQYDKLVMAMELESVSKLLENQLHNFDKDEHKVIQRFLGKMALILLLWGVLPKAARRHYQWVVTMTCAAQERFAHWARDGFSYAASKGAGLHSTSTFHAARTQSYPEVQIG